MNRGLDRPTEGAMLINNMDLSKMSNKVLAWLMSRKIGYIFQTFNILPLLSDIYKVVQTMVFTGEGNVSRKFEKRGGTEKRSGWPKGKILGIVFTFLLIIGIYATYRYTQLSSDYNSCVNKQKASPFTLTDIDGNKVSLEDFVGKVVVLDFFYIRCGWCDDEFLELMKIYQIYHNNDVVIISISVDPNYDTIDRLIEFKRGPNSYSDLNYEISWILTRDTNDVTTKYGINVAPTTVIIDKEGYLSPHSPYAGLTDSSTLLNEITTLLSR